MRSRRLPRVEAVVGEQYDAVLRQRGVDEEPRALARRADVRRMEGVPRVQEDLAVVSPRAHEPRAERPPLRQAEPGEPGEHNPEDQEVLVKLPDGKDERP